MNRDYSKPIELVHEHYPEINIEIVPYLCWRACFMLAAINERLGYIYNLFTMKPFWVQYRMM